MSFSLTTEPIRQRTKTVTRRLGWEFLKKGDLVRAVVKSQGLKKGEHVTELAVLRVDDVRREPLTALLANLDYGIAEVVAEGFAEHPMVQGSPHAFVDFFVNSHRPCLPSDEVTRIQFGYVEA